MSNFERRGLPFRDVFDSSFDDILHVDYLSLEKSKHLLRRRVIGLPIPFIALCYCFSGGLARDLIRSCRRLLEHGMTNSENTSIAELAIYLLEKDIRSKLHALAIAVKDFGIGEGSAAFFEKLRQLERIDITVDSLESNATSIIKGIANMPIETDFNHENDKVNKRFKNLMIELASYLFYCSTILLYFSNKLNQKTLSNAEVSGALSQLARSRQSLSLDPVLTWSIINDFRKSNRLNTIPFSDFYNIASNKIDLTDSKNSTND
jgi:hypothetical protein